MVFFTDLSTYYSNYDDDDDDDDDGWDQGDERETRGRREGDEARARDASRVLGRYMCVQFL